jgi:hypothetical protein
MEECGLQSTSVEPRNALISTFRRRWMSVEQQEKTGGQEVNAFPVVEALAHTGSAARAWRAPSGLHIPTFIPTTRQTSADPRGSTWNIAPAQRTFLDACERQFEIYDLFEFEGTEQIQQLVISRAISGVHIR